MHPAAYIDADKIRDDFVLDRHGGADGASCAGMRIGHDADTAVLGKFLVAQFQDLRRRLFLEIIRKYFGFVVFALDRFQRRRPPYNWINDAAPVAVLLNRWSDDGIARDIIGFLQDDAAAIGEQELNLAA